MAKLRDDDAHQQWSRIELPAGQIVKGDYGLHNHDELAGRKVSSHAEGLAI